MNKRLGQRTLRSLGADDGSEASFLQQLNVKRSEQATQMMAAFFQYFDEHMVTE